MPRLATYPFGTSLVIERHRLDNGLNILVIADPSAPVIAYQTWFAVGSRHERQGKTGIAHLFEHLMFSGSEEVTEGIDWRLEQAGADNNAATCLDWTYYLIDLPKDALALAIELEADRMENLVLAEAQVASEREVVANERRETVEDDIDGTINERLFATAFEQHSYRSPTIGSMADIEGLTTEDCHRFYATHYAPNNATLAIVGDVVPAELVAELNASYGHIPSATIPEHVEAMEPSQTAERRVRVALPTETSRLVVGYKSPAMAHPDHASLTLLNEVLFGGHGSRAHRSLVEDTELASEVAGFVGNHRDPSLWELHIDATEDTSPEALGEGLDKILDDIARQPITESELLRACHRLELSALQELDTASGKAESIGFSEIVLGDPAAQITRRETYRATTVRDLQSVARRLIKRESRTVLEVTS